MPETKVAEPLEKGTNPGHIVEATLEFDVQGWDKEKMDKLYAAEKLLGELGLEFDTGTSIGDDKKWIARHWELDHSLNGPARLVTWKDNDSE